MSERHLAYLSLGSNIQPEVNLVRSIQLLQQYGEIKEISNAWESESVGADGPNYLNACVLFSCLLPMLELKKQILLPIEVQLGRQRTGNRFAPRTMDLDIVIFDGVSCDNKYWEQAFVVIPLAEIHPTYTNPLTGELLTETATRLRQMIWLEARRDVLSQVHGSPFTA